MVEYIENSRERKARERMQAHVTRTWAEARVNDEVAEARGDFGR